MVEVVGLHAEEAGMVEEVMIVDILLVAVIVEDIGVDQGDMHHIDALNFAIIL